MPSYSASASGPYSLWCPPELTAAAGPLHRVGDVLRQLSEDRKGVEHLADRGPSPAVRRALNDFLEAWELVLWKVSGTASSLSDDLRRAAEDYIGSEDDLARRYALAHPDHEGQRR